MVSKLMTHKEAVERFVRDGDYLAYDCNYFQRGPSSLIREIIRQRKKKLWICGKFTYVACALLVESGCADRIDIGFIGFGPWIARAVKEKRVTIYEYSNALMTLRLKAGAMGVPFLPARSFGGTDGFQHSGCKIVEDPFTGKPVLLMPAINPDVSIIHVHQADEFGNARVFGTGIAHTECALASKRVIVSAEEIIDTAEFRNDPGTHLDRAFRGRRRRPCAIRRVSGNGAGILRIGSGGRGRGDGRDVSRRLQRLPAEACLLRSHRTTSISRKLSAPEKLAEIRRRETIREGYNS